MDQELFDFYWTTSPSFDGASNKRRVECTITLEDADPNQTIRYMAAAPPDVRSSYSGSGLPAPNMHHAFSGGHVCGITSINISNIVKLTIPPPNSYWTECGMVLIPPTVYVIYTHNNGKRALHKHILMEEVIPFRDIQHAPYRTDPVFYQKRRAVVMNQDKKLMALTNNTSAAIGAT